SLAISVTPDRPENVRGGSSGLLLPNMEAKIEDPLSGAELGVDENGEVCVRGPNIMLGYLNNLEETASTIRDGWLHTGDVGHVEAKGYIYIVARGKDLIKYRGRQVAPAELEGVLLTNPAIADAAVIPSPDEEAGEVPKAFVVLRSPLTADEI